MSAARAEWLRRSFWLPPALGIVAAVAAAYALSALDSAVDADFGLFSFNDLDSARSVLSTIATVTVSVAGLSFSVTIVALQLASSQLSPRVLTTFREDRLAQGTLAAFIAVFAYSVVLLGRLGTGAAKVPELSMIAAIVGALCAFGLFVAFIGRFVAGLQASTVIRRIAADAERAIDSRHPLGIGEPPADARAAAARVRERTTAGRRVEVRARRGGYLLEISAQPLLAAAREHDALVLQRAQVGDFVITGQLVADAFVPRADDAEPERVAAELERAFRYGEERTMAHDAAFPVRALADVALRALSPAMNDPTTAENALGSLHDILAAFGRRGPADLTRVDADGEPRLLARAPSLDDLVVLGLGQVDGLVADDRMLAERLGLWLDELEREARAHGHDPAEVRRRREALRAHDDRSPAPVTARFR
jgi:uncharacterized membrane protein